MCLICVEFQKGSLTTNEAWRNLQEMKEGMTDEHHDEVVTMIVESILDEDTSVEDEQELYELMENLETDGRISFNWEERTEPGLERYNDLDAPWDHEDYSDFDY